MNYSSGWSKVTLVSYADKPDIILLIELHYSSEIHHIK